ncbi:MAG TPA: exonuclease domain-containing protein [Chitinophagales bacterium]
MFAIVDVETTGSHKSEEKITEIAIIITDGKTVLSEFQSLVNPLRPIDPFVQQLTRITDKMVKNAPTFSEIAEQVFGMLEGKYFVAHNAPFDWALVSRELAAAGFSLNSSRIDTVMYARKIFPNLESYALGKLCRHIGISLSDRHRAYGDTLATVKLFHLLLEKDENQHYLKVYLNHGLDESYLPKSLSLSQFLQVPEQVGIVTFKNDKGNIIAVDSSKNIRKKAIEKIQQIHHEMEDKELFHSISFIDFELTGNELVAKIKKCELLNELPISNSTKKCSTPAYAVILEENSLGIFQLKAVATKEVEKQTYIPFTSKSYANKTIEKLMSENDFYSSYNQLIEEQNERLREPRIIEYNLQIKRALLSQTYRYPNMIIVDKGCDKHHYSVIWVESGRYRGRAFVPTDFPINKNNIEEWIELREETVEIQKHIRAYLRKSKVLKLIRY